MNDEHSRRVGQGRAATAAPPLWQQIVVGQRPLRGLDPPYYIPARRL
jgi:hypothetical protein